MDKDGPEGMEVISHNCDYITVYVFYKMFVKLWEWTGCAEGKGGDLKLSKI